MLRHRTTDLYLAAPTAQCNSEEIAGETDVYKPEAGPNSHLCFFHADQPVGSTRNFRQGFTEVVRHIDCFSLARIAPPAIHRTGEKVFYIY